MLLLSHRRGNYRENTPASKCLFPVVLLTQEPVPEDLTLFTSSTIFALAPSTQVRLVLSRSQKRSGISANTVYARLFLAYVPSLQCFLYCCQRSVSSGVPANALPVLTGETV